MDRARVLIVDDEPAMLENCERLLARHGHRCRTLSDAARVREVLRDYQPDVLLLDLRMPDVDGMTVLTAALADDPTVAVIIMTAFGSVASAVSAIREGAFDYITKPFSGDQLEVAVQRAIRHRGLAIENLALREQIARGSRVDEIVGSSAAFQTLMDQVRKVAPTDANVLLSGESGTGKELIARYLHTHGTRRESPFVPVDCAALPEGLMESELFGYERGAFTGAVGRKTGLLEEGNGGTVFLDEFAELTLGLQSKLLRALEEREIRRLGSSALIDIDIRLVAATSTDLEAAVAAGRFREDLYYRLNVVPLRLPPLRERGGDIVMLAQKFLVQSAAELGKEPPLVSPEVWDALEAHRWPGNVRELRNLAERLIVLDSDGRITLADLPEALRPGSRMLADTLDAPPRPYDEARAQAVRIFQGRYVRHLLEHTGGNVSQAARVAGVSRRTVHRWLEGDDGKGGGTDDA